MELDVLILGAGPAGSVLAHRLASKGFRVAVAERQAFPRYMIGETLTPIVESLLKNVRVLENSELLDFPRTTGNLSAWGSSDLYYSPHSRQNNFCGYQVDRAPFDSMLISSAQRAGASMLQPCWLEEAHPQAAGWCAKVRFRSGAVTAVKAKFLCDATGRSRFLARRLSLRVQSKGRLLGLIAYWKHDSGDRSPDRFNTVVESIPEGWFYTAGLRNDRRVAGFMTDHESLPEHVHSCARQVYSEALARTGHIRHRLRDAVWDGNVRVFAANPSVVERVAGPNWLLVGDSASTMDPLSSQGIQKAITSALAANAVVQTILTRPDRTRLAIEFYQGREETTYRFHLDSLAKLYGRETRWLDQPFWKRRASGWSQPDSGTSPADNGTKASAGQAGNPSLYEHTRFRVSSDTRLLLRPVLEDDRIELQEVAVNAKEPRGIRYCGQVCVPTLLSLMEDGPNFLMLHERYEKAAGTFSTVKLRDVTAHLLELGILSAA